MAKDRCMFDNSLHEDEEKKMKMTMTMTMTMTSRQNRMKRVSIFSLDEEALSLTEQR
jgi:hypothetical protein